MSVEVGQFDDAVEPNSRPGHAYIDEQPVPAASDASDSDSTSSENEEYSEDLYEDDDLRVEDEDWEISERGVFLISPMHVPLCIFCK